MNDIAKLAQKHLRDAAEACGLETDESELSQLRTWLEEPILDLNDFKIAYGPLTVQTLNFVNPTPELSEKIKPLRQGSLLRIADAVYTVIGRRDVTTLQGRATWLELIPYQPSVGNP